MSKKSFIAQERRNMKVKAKSFEAWKVIMITLVFLSYCVGMMPGEKAQAVYDKYLDNGIFGMAFFFVLVGFGIGIHYHKKFINLNKKNYLEFLGKKLGKAPKPI
jgi:peptidoglycan/LPS O-acetylase OafA/YrhL